MRVLSIGECMAEMAPADTNGEFRLGFAGDTFNTAWYLTRCTPDAQVAYFTGLGDDTLSHDLREVMRDARIDDQFVQVAQSKTVGLYMISLNNGERSFSYWRGQSAARALADDPVALADAMEHSDLIYFSGITLGILDRDGRTALLAALATARAAGKTIAFDPNLRPKLWASPSQMTDAIMEGAAVSDIVLPSFEDEGDWFKDASPKATADRYLAAGATTVIVKNGADPVLYTDQTGTGEIAVTPVDTLVDTTAAGDSFNAGVFARLAAGDTTAQAITYACAVSRTVVQHRGALVELDPNTLSVT